MATDRCPPPCVTVAERGCTRGLARVPPRPLPSWLYQLHSRRAALAMARVAEVPRDGRLALRDLLRLRIACFRDDAQWQAAAGHRSEVDQRALPQTRLPLRVCCHSSQRACRQEHNLVGEGEQLGVPWLTRPVRRANRRVQLRVGVQSLRELRQQGGWRMRPQVLARRMGTWQRRP